MSRCHNTDIFPKFRGVKCLVFGHTVDCIDHRCRWSGSRPLLAQCHMPRIQDQAQEEAPRLSWLTFMTMQQEDLGDSQEAAPSLITQRAEAVVGRVRLGGSQLVGRNVSSLKTFGDV